MTDYQPIPVQVATPRPPAGTSPTPKLGLALSGGGFRAAAFHLGALTALDALGVLDDVAVLSTVSGGSIIGAAWVLHRATGRTFADFRASFGSFLTSATIDVPVILSGALDPFHTDTDLLVNAYNEHLFHGTTLGQLPATPILCLNATCLNTGKDWKFYSDVMGDWWFCRNRPGLDWKDRFYPSSNVPLAVAVAASSCFAPVFAPLILPSKTYFQDQQNTVPYIALADGGIYDNQALNALFAAGCTHMIGSDGSKPFEIEPKPGTHQTVYVARTSDIMMNKLRGMEFDKAIQVGRATGIPYAAFFSLDSILPTEQSSAVAKCNIPTRLKALTAEELDALVAHGQALATDRVKKYVLASATGASVKTIVTTGAQTIEEVPK